MTENIRNITERLDKCLAFLTSSKNALNADASFDDVRNTVRELLRFTYTLDSDLYMLFLLVDEMRKEKRSTIENNIFIVDCKNIVRKWHFEKDVFGSFHQLAKVDDFLDERDLRSYLRDTNKWRENLNKWNYKGIKEFDKSKLVEAGFEIIKYSLLLLDAEILSRHNIVDVQYESNLYEHEFIDYWSQELNFYDCFISGKATLNDWKKFPNTGFFLYYEGTQGMQEDYNVSKIHIIQQKLFEQAISEELNVLKSEITELPQEYQLENAKNQLSIIDKFLTGSFSELDFKRINNIIEFIDADEVILELDDMKRYSVYNYDKYLPYDGPNGKRSPRLVAEVLTSYRDFLSNHITKLDLIQNPLIFEETVDDIKEDFQLTVFHKGKPTYHPKPTLPKPSAFKLKMRPKKEAILREVVTDICKYDLIDYDKNHPEDLIDVFLTSNFKLVSKPIYFGTNTNFCCAILRELFIYFENMDAKIIESSNLFFTKSGGKLTQTNFNKSVNQLKGKTKELDEIKKIIKRLA